MMFIFRQFWLGARKATTLAISETRPQMRLYFLHPWVMQSQALSAPSLLIFSMPSGTRGKCLQLEKKLFFFSNDVFYSWKKLFFFFFFFFFLKENTSNAFSLLNRGGKVARGFSLQGKTSEGVGNLENFIIFFFERLYFQKNFIWKTSVLKTRTIKSLKQEEI